MAGKKKLPDFEENLAQLEKLVHEMEQGELSLEDSLKAFEQGIKITRICQQALSNAEQQVEILTAEQTEDDQEDLLNT